MRQSTPFEVLIAEDDAILNDGIARQLRLLGYAIAGQAYDGLECVQMACNSQKTPDVVLMDLQMIDPETGNSDPLAGLRATRHLQERRPVPVVLLTAHESPELVKEAGAAGVAAYLVKPARNRDLERAITIAIARFEDCQQLRRLTTELKACNEELKQALAKIKTLSGLIPICASCKKIRDDRGFWEQVEIYIEKHSNALFTHGICPDCGKKLYPGLNLENIGN
jgi:AmiR/NasT family two-component response regulator